MKEQRTFPLLGLQATFLVFAVALLEVPLAHHLLGTMGDGDELRAGFERLVLLLTAALLLVAVPPLRRRCAILLEPRISRSRLHEVPMAVTLNLACVFAIVGAHSLWVWSVGGEPALARHLGGETRPAVALENALSVGGLFISVLIGGVIAPLIEELVFRGVLYSAWRQALGWLASALASSAAFQAFHGFGVAQLIAGLIYTALMRRSGSIRSSIYAHSIFNLLMWYPLVGQVLVPAGASTGEIRFWAAHFACLAIVAVALPWYLWSARDSRTRSPDPATQPET